VRILIDPLYTRLPGDKPHLEAKREELDRVDYLLLTHGHLDHSWDVPYIVVKHNPATYAPEECLGDVRKEAARAGAAVEWSRCHGLEQASGKPFAITDIEVTPYRIGTEEIDFWFIREMFIRPWKHMTPSAIPTGFRWLFHHVFGNCFAYLFRFPPDGATMLYFGNLTEDVRDLGSIERVNVLAIPYCPANNKWIQQTQYLINRFRPDVTLVHHFDNFMNPYTLSKYMNLENYRRAVQEKCPDATFHFSKFGEEVRLTQIL